ncbi:MAG: NADH-quinone oxidoreductase subunit N [Leptospiraceae bacterium]|nr:NADH-quinone oxidoreductase subunit N [Leptospiraceae bacterium]MDW8305667.1 NADH-quinone oxidoreductase subunit N [Leptospiraceae bacterium]
MVFFQLKDLVITCYANITLLAALFSLTLQMILPRLRAKVSFLLALLSTLVNILILIWGLPLSGELYLPPLWEQRPPLEGFMGHVIWSGYTRDFSLLLVVVFLFVLLLSQKFLQELELNLPEFYQMMLFSLAGLLYLIQAQDLITLLVALELSALPVFILVAFRRQEKSANEAAMKYFLLSVIATAFLLMGTGFLFGASGGFTNLFQIGQQTKRLVPDLSQPAVLFALVGWLFVISALAFKAALVPFHGWTADVYEGSITLMTAFMASLIKIAAFALIFRVLLYIPEYLYAHLRPVFFVLAVASMVLGNVGALTQQNLKRLFAYSSIAHAGYMAALFLFPIGSALLDELRKESAVALYFYLTGYALTSVMVFFVIHYLERTGQGERQVTFAEIKGLSQSHPLAAFFLSVGALSLAGIPPLLGFFGKFYLLRAIFAKSQLGLAIIVAINSLIAVYYYARVVFSCYWDFAEKPVAPQGIWQGVFAKVAGFSLLLLVLLMGLLSSPVIKHSFTVMQYLR